jgi:hypothetical protein
LVKLQPFLRLALQRPRSRSSCYSSRCLWQHHGGSNWASESGIGQSVISAFFELK